MLVKQIQARGQISEDVRSGKYPLAVNDMWYLASLLHI